MADLAVTLRIDGNAAGIVKAGTAAERSLGGISKAAGVAGSSASRGFSVAGEATANLSAQFSRLRSNVLLAAAAVSTAAVVRSFVAGITSASSALEGYRQGLTAAAGSQQGAAVAMAFVRAESERLGTDLRVSAQAYTSLAAAAKGTALEGQATRDVFSAVSEAARVLNLSADQTSGALQALQQMVSKGTVQAEELRGQLGERLPGAFGLAARAMGKTTAELGKMLEQGQVTADELLPKLAAELHKTFGAQAAVAANTPAAEMQRLSNAVFELQAAIGDAGFMAALANGARALTATLTGLVQSGSIDTLVTGIAAIGAAALVALSGRVLGAFAEFADARRKDIISASIAAEMNRTLAATALESAQAKSVELTESLRAIEAVRAEIIAKQRLAASDVAVAEAALSAATANNQGSFALKVQREATEQLIAAKARLTSISTELAALGVSQNITQQNLARSAASQVAAQGALNSALAQGGVVMQGLRAAGSRLFAFIGGWPTVALAAAAGLYQLWAAVRDGKAAARAPITALEELNAQLEKRVTLARLIASGQATEANAAEVSTLVDAKNKALELTQQLERARDQLAQLQSGGGAGDRVLSALITSQRNAIASLEEDLNAATVAVRQNAEAVAKLALLSGDLSQLPPQFVKLAQDAGGAADELKRLLGFSRQVAAVEPPKFDQRFADQLSKNIAAAKAERIELTKGFQARLEYEALLTTGAQSVDQLDQRIRDLIKTQVSERAAIDAAKAAQQAGNKTREEAIRTAKELLKAGEDFRAETVQMAADLEGPAAQAFATYATEIAKANDLLTRGGISVADFADRQAQALESLNRTTAAIAAQRAPIEDMLDDLRFEGDLIGLGNTQREIAIALRNIEADAQANGTKLTQDEIEAKKRLVIAQIEANAGQRDLMDAATKAAEEYQSVWRNATDSVSRAFGDLVTGGIKSFKSFGQALRDILRQTLSDMIAMIVRSNVAKLMSGFSAALAGAVPGAAAASPGGTLGSASSLLGGITQGGGLVGNLLGSTFGSLGSAITGLAGLGGALGGFGAGLTVAGNAGLLAAGQFGVASLAAGNLAVGFGALIPVVGAIAGAAVLVNKLTGGGLFGTKFKTVSSGVDFTIGDSGASGFAFQNQTKEKALFGGKKSRTLTSALDAEAQQAIDDLFAQLTGSLAEAAKALGVAVPPLVSGSFRQEFDKKGNLKKEFSTIAGRVYNEGQAAFAQRLQAENIVALIDSALNLDSLGAAQNEASQIAERWRSNAETLLAGTQFLLLAATDLRNGFNLLGTGTLTDITTLVEDLAKAGEPLAQAYARVSVSTQLLEQALDLSGVTLTQTGDAFVRFAVDIADAAGGLDRAQALWSDYFQRFFSDTERAQLALNDALSNAAKQFADINLDANSFTGDGGAEAFRALFEQALPTLSAEAVVEWLEAANALGLVLDATGALNQSLGDTANATEEAAQALAEKLGSFMDNITSQARDAADALADFGLAPLAAGLQQIARDTERAAAEALALGASEEQLAAIRAVGAQQAELLQRQAAAELADLLTGVNTALFELDASPLEIELGRIQAAMQNTLLQATALGASEEQLALIRQLGAAQAAAAQASAQAALDAAAQQAADALAQQRAQLADLIGGVNTALFELDASPLETELARIQSAMQNTLAQASALGASEEQLALIRQLGARQAAQAQAAAAEQAAAIIAAEADKLRSAFAQIADAIAGLRSRITDDVQSLRAAAPGFDAVGFNAGRIATLRAQLAAGGDAQTQIGLIEQIRAATLDRFAAEQRAVEALAQTQGQTLDAARQAAEASATAIEAEAEKVRAAFEQIAEAIGTLRSRISDDVQSLRAAAPGFDAVGFQASRIATLRAQLAAGGDAQAQLGLIEQIRASTLDRFAAEQKNIETIGQLQDQQAADAARRADEQLRAAQQAHNEAMQSWQAQQQAAQRLRGFVDNLGLSSVSPLTAFQRFDEAKALFERAKASGDAEALQSTAQAFLEETRNVFGVSDKAVSIFNDVRGTLGNRANQLASSSAPVFQAPALEDALSSTTGAVIDTTAEIERLREAAIGELQGLDTLLSALREQQSASASSQIATLDAQAAAARADAASITAAIATLATDTTAEIERLREAAIGELQGLDTLLSALREQQAAGLSQSLAALGIGPTATAAAATAVVNQVAASAAEQTSAAIAIDTAETARHEARLAVLREQRTVLDELLAEQRAGRVEQRADGTPRILPIRSTDAVPVDGVTFDQAYLDKFLVNGIGGNGGGLQEAGQARRSNPGTGPIRDIQPLEDIRDGIAQFVEGQAESTTVTTGFLREQERRLIELIAAQKEMGERIQRTMEAVIRSGVRP